MAVGVAKSDGSVINIVPGTRAEEAALPVGLLRDGMVGYGDTVNQNMVRLVENFAASVNPADNDNVTSGNVPAGMLWFNTSDQHIKINKTGDAATWTDLLDATDAAFGNVGTDKLVKRDSGGHISVRNIDAYAITATGNIANSNVTLTDAGAISAVSASFTSGITVSGGISSNNGAVAISGGGSVSGDLTVTGNLTVTGTQTSSQQSVINGHDFVINEGQTDGPSQFKFQRSGGRDPVLFQWDDAESKFKLTDPADNTPKEIITARDAIIEGRYLKNRTITAGKIAANTISHNEIGPNAVTSSELANGAVFAVNITDNAVTGPKIKNGAVTRDKLGANAVTTVKINNGAINGDKIAANSHFSLNTLKVAGSTRLSILDVPYDDGLTIRGQAGAGSPSFPPKMKIDAQGRIFIGTSLSTSSADIANNQGISIKPSGTTWGHNHSITSPEIYFTGERVNNNGRISWNDVIIRANPPTTGGNIVVSRKNDGNLISFRNTGHGTNTLYDAHISIDDGTVTYATTSDKRLKKNITTITDGLKTINALRPVKFNFKSQKKGAAKLHGLIAQEVEKVNPKFVVAPNSNEPDDYYNIDYSRFVPDLIAAVQELSAKVEALEAASTTSD